MSAAILEPLVRLPSGRVVGAEVNDRGNLVPHEWDCDCGRCDPVAEAKRQRVRDAAPDLLEALQVVVERFDHRCFAVGDQSAVKAITDMARAAIAKAAS